MRKPNQNTFLSVRLTKPARKAFVAKAARHGKPSEVLRELIVAFTEERVTITPPVNAKESLYVTRIED